MFASALDLRLGRLHGSPLQCWGTGARVQGAASLRAGGRRPSWKSWLEESAKQTEEEAPQTTPAAPLRTSHRTQLVLAVAACLGCVCVAHSGTEQPVTLTLPWGCTPSRPCRGLAVAAGPHGFVSAVWRRRRGRRSGAAHAERELRTRCEHGGAHDCAGGRAGSGCAAGKHQELARYAPQRRRGRLVWVPSLLFS